MSLCNDPELNNAYDQVRDDKSSTNWVIFDFDNTKLKVGQTGDDGFEGVKQALLSRQTTAAFAFVRLNLSNDPHSVRTKFVMITWCGPETPVMRKARLSVQKAEVQEQVLRSITIDISADSEADLVESEILDRLRKVGGANYDRQSSNY